MVDDQVQFERTAIGEHLLLGGDNLDLALARRVEEKLHAPKLGLRQSHALRRACCAAKERLLSEPSLERLPISVLGSGRSVVGGTLTAELTRDEVLDILTGGFLPLTAPDDLPAHDKRVGLRELGLPYASDPAITKHLAAFLTRAAATAEPGPEPPERAGAAASMARPDAILFNGGFFAPPVTREKIVDAVAGWFVAGTTTGARGSSTTTPPKAPWPLARRITAGCGARAVCGSGPAAPGPITLGCISDQRPQAVCVLPAGIEEGATLPLPDREFAVLTNRPVSFTLYSSTMRHDAHGALAEVDEEQIHRHAPLVTLLRFGKKSRQIELGVQLKASFTEVGTLELWCESLSTQHRWRLQFELRGDEGQQPPGAPEPEQAPVPIAPERLDEAGKLIRAVFGSTHGADEHEAIGPDAIVGKLESTLARNKDSWPVATIRSLCDVLAEVAGGRTKSRRHEARWLNLFGFCLRPGFGALLDDWRINQARRVYMAGLAFPNDPQCQVEWLVLWRRVVGGFNAGQQRELYQKYGSLLGVGGKKAGGRLNARWSTRVGGCWPAWNISPCPSAYPWVSSCSPGLRRNPATRPGSGRWAGWARASLCMGRSTRSWESKPPRSGSRRFSICPNLRRKRHRPLSNLGHARTIDCATSTTTCGRRPSPGSTAAGTSPELTRGLHQYVPPAQADAMRIFGESLPEGLRIMG